MDHWRGTDGQKVVDLLPTAARMFGRGINNFAASAILCERGSAVAAASLARSIAEVSFWLAYMAKAPDDALSDLEADDLKNWIAREKELQRVTPDQPELLAQSKINQASYVAKLAGRTPPTIGAFAKKFGSPNGYLKYRIMSGFYSHLSHASLGHNLLKTGATSGTNILGPHSREIPKAIYFACDSLIDCGAAYSKIVKDPTSVEAFEKAGVAVAALRNRPHPDPGW